LNRTPARLVERAMLERPAPIPRRCGPRLLAALDHFGARPAGPGAGAIRRPTAVGCGPSCTALRQPTPAEVRSPARERTLVPCPSCGRAADEPRRAARHRILACARARSFPAWPRCRSTITSPPGRLVWLS
jgi:hypothetical protein